MQTGTVLGSKSWGWTARVDGQKVTLLPERARIMEGQVPRRPRPAEKHPKPQHKDKVIVFGTEYSGERVVAQIWALKPA